jgi:hypothetical protein
MSTFPWAKLLAALGVTAGWIAVAAGYGALTGYVGVLQTRHAPERQRIRELRETVGKGSGGDLARAKVAEMERQLAADSDSGPAMAAAKSKAATVGAIAFVAALPFLIGWIYRQRLSSLPAG